MKSLALLIAIAAPLAFALSTLFLRAPPAKPDVLDEETRRRIREGLRREAVPGKYREDR